MGLNMFENNFIVTAYCLQFQCDGTLYDTCEHFLSVTDQEVKSSWIYRSAHNEGNANVIELAFDDNFRVEHPVKRSNYKFTNEHVLNGRLRRSQTVSKTRCKEPEIAMRQLRLRKTVDIDLQQLNEFHVFLCWIWCGGLAIS